MANPGFQRGGVLKLRPDTKSGGGGAVGFWPDTKSGWGGGGGGGGVVLLVSGPIQARI